MPAIGTRLAVQRVRPLRLVGLALLLTFLASLATTAVQPVAARDWTPQIQTTRRAQIYWESVMRSADADLRGLKKSKKRAQQQLKRMKLNLAKAGDKRVSAKRRLNAARRELNVARVELRSLPVVVAPPPDAAAALQALLPPPLGATPVDAFADALSPPALAAGPAATLAERRTLASREVKTLERTVKSAKRDFKQAKRKAKRRAGNVRAASRRLASLKAAERSAKGRRSTAERNLGSWILAMNKYGRIRATKKSDARPGVNSAFAWPVTGGRISQYYHAGHDGLDIVRYLGAPVRSMAFGVVTYVGWNPWDQHGRAFMVVVTHAGGYETLYGHLLPRRVVRVGEEVRKGQVVGYMGSTGNSTGPHLHLELRRGRTTINPLGYL